MYPARAVLPSPSRSIPVSRAKTQTRMNGGRSVSCLGQHHWHADWVSQRQAAGPGVGDARVCSERYCTANYSVPAKCFRWRCMSRLALLHGVASDAWGARGSEI